MTLPTPEGAAPEDPARHEGRTPAEPAPTGDAHARTDAPAAPGRPRRALSFAGRVVRGLLLVVLALLVGALVGLALVDPGPALRARAEREGSRLIERPIRIGRLSVGLLRGRFVLDDVVIDNVRGNATPFFSAKRIVVRMPWWTIVSRREILIESVEVSRWSMLVETYAGGGHNFIRLPRRRPRPPGERRYVTTVQLVRVTDGTFTYLDHGTPWSTVARNLDVTIAKLQGYRGEARFRGGTIRIQRYEPMWANMYCTFDIDGGRVVLDRIDLETDGARSDVTGVVDLGRWPEQSYEVRSRIQLARMREIFFAANTFSLSGEADFRGRFHLFKGGRDLGGGFASAEAGLNAWRFPGLRGTVRWLPDRLEVTDTTSGFYGGRLALTYTMAPLGKPTPAIARLETTLRGVDLARFTDFLDRPVLRLAGGLDNRNVLEWPLGRWREHRGGGELRATPPAGVTLMTRALPAGLENQAAPDMGPFNPLPLHGYLPIGGELSYQFGPEWIDVSNGAMSTPRTFVSFEGRTAYGERSVFPFHVTSADWQESDRVLAGIISAFGSVTRAVPVGGHGEFDGVMTGAFTRPHVTGRFRAGRMRAWNVTWGDVDGEVTIFDSYADIRAARVRSGEAAMDVNGKFSLGYPRRDGGEEINARVQLHRWPLADLRHAFELDAYPIEGLVSGEFHLFDRYIAPQGFGRLTVDQLVAYGERFDRASAGLRFEGKGVRLDGIDARMGPGTMTGAAYVGWDGTYSFNADARALPVERLHALAYPQAPMTGVLHLSANGSGAFESPRYELRARIDDFTVASEPVGQVSGHLVVRDDVLTFDQLEASSSRLAVSARGRVALTPEADGEILLQVHDTALDPFIRALRPGFSPSTSVMATGTVRVFGELRNPDGVRGEAVVDRVAARLFDYDIRNDGDIRLSLVNQTLRVDRLRVVGQGTALEVFGDVEIPARRIALRALGDTDLGLAQGFVRDIRSSGAAELQADIRGTFDSPTVLGALQVRDGRLRHFALPHGLENINGRVVFDASGLRIDDVRGRLGGGAVRIDGRLGFRGWSPTEYNIDVVGDGMRLRYPEGVQSLVDADLALRGNFFSPLLTGTVIVRSATLERTFDTAGTGVFGIAATGLPTSGAVAAGATRIPVRFDVRLLAPSSLRIDHRAARLVASAELTLRGTYDQPVVFGRVEIDRGELLFEGNRYQVTRGIVDFVNPARIEPLFDVEAETRVRVPGQVYRVQIRVAGTPEHFTPDLSSDPPLAPVDILSLLFGDVRDPQNAEVRALQSPQQAEQELLYARAARLLASPISSNVSRVVEEAIGVDTVQITPMLSDILAQQSSRITPSARLTLGKRISERIFLSYSRALNASTRDEIILLEFDQNDRLSWIVSQNEDRTYAIDVRVRHVF